MPRSRAVRTSAIVAGLLLVIVGGYLGSPLFIRTTANEALPTATVSASAAGAASGTSAAAVASSAPTSAAQPTTLARGELQFVDSLHNGRGPVALLRVGEARVLRFEGVAITNAPDVHVYLSRETGGKWNEATSLYLGALKATNGSFNYDIPSGADLAPFKSVVVWCRAFAVLITWADLKIG